VSFETIEHLAAEEQLDMISEFARVLAPGGVLVISSPNKRLYSDARGYENPFHSQELYRNDLVRLLNRRFPAQRWYHQRLAYWSGIWSEPLAAPENAPPRASSFEAWVGDAARIVPYQPPEGMYFIVVAGRDATALPVEAAALSLFTDADESEIKRAEANAREVLRLDALLRETNDAVARHSGHIHHLETLVAERERLVVERDAALARHAEGVSMLETLVAARDAVIAERDRQLEEASTLGVEREAEVSRRNETVAGLAKRSAILELEKLRLEAELAAQGPKIARLESFGGWISWPWRRLIRWVAR